MMPGLLIKVLLSYQAEERSTVTVYLFAPAFLLWVADVAPFVWLAALGTLSYAQQSNMRPICLPRTRRDKVRRQHQLEHDGQYEHLIECMKFSQCIPGSF